MTLELSPELEKEIEAAARERGTDAPSFVIEAARRALNPDTPALTIDEIEVSLRVLNPFAPHEGDALTPDAEAAQTRREVAAAGLGMFAGHGPTVDEFLAMRHAEGQADARGADAGHEAQLL